MKKYTIALLLIIGSTFLIAQSQQGKTVEPAQELKDIVDKSMTIDPAADLEKLFQTYTSGAELKMNVNYHFYENASALVPSDSLVVEIHLNNKQNWMRTPYCEMLQGSEQLLYIDIAQQQILKQPVTQSMPNSFNPAYWQAILQNEEMTIAHEEKSEWHREIILTSPKNSETVIQIEYDPTTWRLLAMDMILGEEFRERGDDFPGGRLQAKYDYLDTNQNAFPTVQSVLANYPNFRTIKN